MPAVCLILQLHVPAPLRGLSVFELGAHPALTDEKALRSQCNKVFKGSWLPLFRAFQRLHNQYGERFRIALACSGAALERLETASALESVIRQLNDAGAIEWLAQPHAYSLSFAFDREEFRLQVTQQADAIEKKWGVRPSVLLNTEWMYSNYVAWLGQIMGMKGVLTEGVPAYLKGRSLQRVYQAPHSNVSLFLRDSGWSDSLAFGSLAPGALAGAMHRVAAAEAITVGLDAPFVEESPLAGMLEAWIIELLRHDGFALCSPSQLIDPAVARDALDVPSLLTRAGAGKDLTQWMDNSLQNAALNKLYALGKRLRKTGNEDLLKRWLFLQEAQHFAAMSLDRRDGNPLDAYAHYMNALADLQIGLPAD